MNYTSKCATCGCEFDQELQELTPGVPEDGYTSTTDCEYCIEESEQEADPDEA